MDQCQWTGRDLGEAQYQREFHPRQRKHDRKTVRDRQCADEDQTQRARRPVQVLYLG